MTFCTQPCRKKCHSYFNWSLYFQGTNLTCPGVFVLVSPIATQDWPQLQVSSPTSVRARSIGTLPEMFLSSTVPPAGFLHGFSLWSTISCSRALHLQHGNSAYSGAWALSQVPVCLQWTYPRLLGMRIIARGFPQLFSNVSLAVPVPQFQNDCFEMSVPLLLTTSLLVPQPGGR